MARCTGVAREEPATAGYANLNNTNFPKQYDPQNQPVDIRKDGAVPVVLFSEVWGERGGGGGGVGC